MVKYFILLVLLAGVALECTNINNRMFPKSETYKPLHHVRLQNHDALETSEHNNHREHQNNNHRHNPHPHRHHLPHNSHQHLQPEHDQYAANQGNREVDEFPSKNTDDVEGEKPKYKSNLWHIVRKDLLGPNSHNDDYYDDPAMDLPTVNNDRVNEEDDSDVNNKLDTKIDSRLENHRQIRKDEPIIKCPKCETSNRQNVRVSEEELTLLRIEFVKTQILEKLRLKDKPNVSAVGMPKPIYEETTIHQDQTTSSKDLDDYYARASKKFIVLEREKQECNNLSQPSICFSFKIDDLDLESIDVSKAVLWIFKKRNSKDLLKQTIVVSEVEQGGLNSKYLPKVKPIAIQSVDVQEGWMKIDIEWPIKRWFGIHDLSHLIHISCQSCEIETADGLISTEKDYRPFIKIDTQNRRRVSRQKRSVNCTNGVTECCRERLYISFDEIGWGDWIISPKGYDAYFCRGSCSTVASIAQSSTHHSSLMRKVISHRDTAGKKPLELIPCCTANQYSSLEIFFRDSNNTATLMKFPNMVIESCGCM
ncbi:growth/differentiation factor 8 [Eupeodes corollae]|uniref:growth/differentiation factor 8 n=1 Tax=Eupeodes corollae TaxID=290404 RepID=UPI00249366AA|nr:growth/differentiation factor 8 [Eupeodes corollae]XP_055922100.1 growth/differentiation factor 8 [Eupeodes corollae]